MKVHRLGAGENAKFTVHHPLKEERYTPITPQVLDLMWRMHERLGTWRDVSAVTGLKLRVIRKIRNGEHLTVSLTIVDKMVTTTGVGSVNDYVWFTPDDLVKLGLWKPITPEQHEWWKSRHKAE